MKHIGTFNANGCRNMRFSSDSKWLVVAAQNLA
jgi:hypothetical protein